MDQLTTTLRHQSWLQMIQAQKASGLTIDRWCRENDIGVKTFYYRQHRLRLEAGDQMTQFVEINQPAKAGQYLDNLTYSAASIVSGNVVIGLSNDASEELISRIVRVLHAQ